MKTILPGQFATLYLLRSTIFREDGGPFFCPDCAMIEGYLTYFPTVRQQLDIRYIDYTRPRAPLANLVGEDNQGSPALIIRDGADSPWGRMIGGVRLIDNPREIMSYLSTEFEVGHRLPPRPASP